MKVTKDIQGKSKSLQTGIDNGIQINRKVSSHKIECSGFDIDARWFFV